MITPNKVISLGDSVIGRMSSLLTAADVPSGVADVYQSLSGKFESIDQFILALDVLYILDRIDVDMKLGVVKSAA